MTISSSGYSGGFTIPATINTGTLSILYPSFSCNIGNFIITSGTIIPFSLVDKTSPICSLNASTFAITVNISGTYELYCSFYLTSYITADSYSSITVTGSFPNNLATITQQFSGQGVSGNTATGTVIFSVASTAYIAAGSVLVVQPNIQPNSVIDNDSRFTYLTMFLVKGGT